MQRRVGVQGLETGTIHGTHSQKVWWAKRGKRTPLKRGELSQGRRGKAITGGT